MRWILVIGYILHLSVIINVRGQINQGIQNQLKFNYITIDQGLSNNNIRTICQDSKGFIWFGSLNGLNKYDGQSITTYWNDAGDTNSVSSNLINSIILDSKNNLWISGDGGLDHYNMDYNNFSSFKHKNITWPIEQVYDMAEDKNGVLWFGGISGLYSYDPVSSEVKHFGNIIYDTNGVFPNLVYKILIDNKNKVWISVLNEGIYLYDQINKNFTVFKNDKSDNNSISGDRIESLYKDNKGNIWIGTLNNGLNLFIPESNSFKRFIPDQDNNYSTRIRAMFEDLKGNFFIGTRGGLYYMNNTQNKFTHYAYESHSFSKLSQNSVLESFIDKTGILWIGTFAGGVNYTNLNQKEFTHYIAGKDDNHFLSSSNIYAITEDKKGNLWVGGDNGLNYLDRNSYTFKYYQNDPKNHNTISYNDIKALEWDKKGNLWIGTNRGGLNYYNIKTGKFISYQHDPNDTQSIAGNKVYCLLNDKFNNLWIILNPDNEFINLNIDILPDGSDKFIHLNETSYFGFDQNKKGDVYIGGKNGFWIFNCTDSVYNFISNDSLIGNSNTIREDSKGNIWIGSNMGLTKYNIKNATFKLYNKERGYPIGEVYGIQEDNDKNLWISTNSGLVKLSNIVKDSLHVDVRLFDQYDGLQSKQFNYNASFKCKSGEMIFGGINGFNTFFPENIIDDTIPAEVIITNLRIFNNPVPIGEKIGGRVILEKSISVTKEIVLGPKQNIFTLEFATLQNTNPEKFTFKTKLEGLDKNWQYRKSGNNQVTYTNLSAGEYTFLISVANRDGFWNNEPVKLKISVIPPIWKTLWFRIIFGLLIFIIFSGIYYFRLRSIRIQNLLLEKTVKNRTQEITKKNKMLQEANILLKERQEKILTQNEELEQHRNNLASLVHERTLELEKALEKAKESDALKSSFLANMSHEIRTPMNAIMGFSNMLNENEHTPEDRAHFIQLIQSNADNLLKIIDEILDLSMIESKQLRIINHVFDLNVLIDQLYSYYALSNANKDLEIKKNNTLKEHNLILNSDSVRIKQVLTNLMDNAVKFTQEGIIEIGVYTKNENLCMYVKDTGKGIPLKEIDNIFLQFTKIEDEYSDWKRGIGLGLAISQKISNALGGVINVESIESEGSVFTLEIPMKNIVRENVEVSAAEYKKPIEASWPDKTILIAEDEEANYRLLETFLKKTQIKIVWARDGDEVITIIKKIPQIDLILMDIKMPVLDGYEAAKIIKKKYPHKIIIAQTAYARVQEKYKFYDENFDEYLSKPINQNDLIKTLNKFL